MLLKEDVELTCIEKKSEIQNKNGEVASRAKRVVPPSSAHSYFWHQLPRCHNFEHERSSTATHLQKHHSTRHDEEEGQARTQPVVHGRVKADGTRGRSPPFFHVLLAFILIQRNMSELFDRVRCRDSRICRECTGGERPVELRGFGAPDEAKKLVLERMAGRDDSVEGVGPHNERAFVAL